MMLMLVLMLIMISILKSFDFFFFVPRRCRCVKAGSRVPRIEARSAQTAHGSVLGSANKVSVQLTPNWLAPAPGPRSALLALGLLFGRLLSLLLLIEQEGFCVEVRQRFVGFLYLALGGFSLRQRCRQQPLLLVHQRTGGGRCGHAFTHWSGRCMSSGW